MKKKILTTLVLSTILAVLLSVTVQAYQIDPSFRPINSPFDLNYGSDTSKTILILQILSGALLYFAAPVAIILIIIGALQIVIGGAESDKIDAGKKHITWSVIGLLVIILSYSIVRTIINFVLKSAQTPTS